MTEWTEDLIDVDRTGTLDRMFCERVRRSPRAIAYRQFDRTEKKWRDTSWGEMGELVGRWQAALRSEGLETGARVAVLLRNSREWIAFDQAALGLGLVVVPLYTDDRPDNVSYIIQDAGVELLLIQDRGRWRRLAEVLPAETCLRRAVILEGADSASDDARAVLAADWLPADGELARRDGDRNALASIVYTSGTTGRPKGVMLSHHNMMSVAHAALVMVDCYREDVFLSFLPLSHTLERTAGYYLPMMAGAAVAFSRSVAQLGDDLAVVRPTALIAVPRIFEKVYGRIRAQMTRQSGIVRRLFDLAVRVGWHRFEYRQGRRGPGPGLLLWPLLRRLVADKITARLGGRLRITVSGGAALAPEISRVFIGLGIPLLQGYGLTETSPVLSVNSLADNRPDSVGLMLRGMQARIGEDDELQVLSPGIMLGYWNNHAATSEVIGPDGWLRTGDQARIEDGHIYITGRIKDILVLSNGEKAPPADMELAMALDPHIEQAMVTGEGKPYLSALVVLDGDRWPTLAQEHGLDPMAPESLHDRKLQTRVLGLIREALKDFPGYAKVRRVTLLLEPWSVDNGLLTPTMKVKRAKVLEQYAADVAAMYD